MFSIIVLALLLCSLVFFTYLYGISPMPSHRKALKVILKILEEKQPKNMVDLGSGWGSLGYCAAKRLVTTQITGYEGSWVPWCVSACLRKKRLRFIRKNFYKVSLEKYDVVFCYLYPGAMQKLKKKFEKELKNAWVISNTFQVPGWEPQEVHPVHDFYGSSIYVYYQ